MRGGGDGLGMCTVLYCVYCNVLCTHVYLSTVQSTKYSTLHSKQYT
jgi:hypothetical protein